MKKFAQMAVLVLGLAGLSACAATSHESEDMRRTAGGVERADMESLRMCEERVRRLEEMNRSCYRK